MVGARNIRNPPQSRKRQNTSVRYFVTLQHWRSWKYTTPPSRGRGFCHSTTGWATFCKLIWFTVWSKQTEGTTNNKQRFYLTVILMRPIGCSVSAHPAHRPGPPPIHLLYIWLMALRLLRLWDCCSGFCLYEREENLVRTPSSGASFTEAIWASRSPGSAESSLWSNPNEKCH